MLKNYRPSRLLSHLLACSALLLLPLSVEAELIQTDDYIYIGIEAEDHDAKDDRWVLTEPGTATQADDPDGNHSDQASGQQYLELLPDVRVTHADTFGPPTAYWGQPGQGPFADYTIDVPESGRYYVHIRAYSTGTEDNGIHVGFDGTWPVSGRTMQFCTAHLQAWTWSSAQRDAGGNGSCGMEKTIWLDIPTAGTHTFSISAREDGFEIDRIALIKDLSDNTKVCTPTNINNVSCVNGSIESADSFIDLRLILSGEPAEIAIDEALLLTAKVENLDAFDTATDITATVEFDADTWTIDSVDEACTLSENVATCLLSSLHPTAPNEFEAFEFNLTAKIAGAHRIDGSLSATEIDENPNNDVAATIIDVSSEPGAGTDVSVSISTDVATVKVGENLTATIVVSNEGVVPAKNTMLTFNQPNNIQFDTSSLPAGCSGTDTIICELNEMDAASSQSFAIVMSSDMPGTYVLPVSVSASNNENATNDQYSTIVLITGEASSTEGESSGGATDDASSTSGTTTEGTTTEGSTTEGSTGSGTSTEGTDGASDNGASDGSSGTTTTGSTTEGGSTTEAVDTDSDAGSFGVWLLMLLSVWLLASSYRRHQRQHVLVGK